MVDLQMIPSFLLSINDFFSRMFGDILAGRVTMESVILVIAFFGCFALLTTFAFVFQKKPVELMRDHPMTWITDYHRIMELLEASVTQRSKVRVSFHRDLGAARSTDGTFIDVNKNQVVLEISSIKTINPAWVGRTLQLHFRLRLPEQPQLQTNFGFVSDILSYQHVEEDIIHLNISRPLRLELNQNRLHLRVEPPDKYIKSFCLWPEDAVRRRGDPKEPDSWGDPLYSLDSGVSRDIRLENISGGGLRLEFFPETLRTKAHKITVNQQYFCRLTVATPDLSGFSTHYILTKVLKCYDDCDSKSELSLGMSFAGAGVPYEPPLTGLQWRTVNRDFGISELDDWAYELHLELYRNKGIV
jgi:hypothetical protein